VSVIKKPNSIVVVVQRLGESLTQLIIVKNIIKRLYLQVIVVQVTSNCIIITKMNNLISEIRFLISLWRLESSEVHYVEWY